MLQQIWNNLANIGYSETLNEKQLIKLRIMNKLLFMVIILATSLVLLYLVFLDNSEVAIYHSVSIFLGLTFFLLHHYRFYNLVKHSCCFLFPIWVAIAISYLQNNSSGESTVFLVVSMVAFIQYEGQFWYKISCITLNIFLAIGSLLYIDAYAPVYLNTHGFMVLLVGIIISVGFIIQFYQNDLQEIVNQKDDLVQQLQLKNVELERFAYITSHDLKEPVKNIEGFSSLLKKLLTRDSTAENAQMAAMIHDSSKRMTVLIDSILKYSKLEKDDLQMELVDLTNILQEFKKSHNHLLINKKAIIQYGNLPTIKGNKVYLSLLFQNLLENAIKYNDAAIPSVKIFAHQENNHIRLVINDNGIGIEKEYEDYIFEPFRRLHNRSKYEGTGLGLAICKKIVDNHSGKIWVESTKKGSQFNILLPNIDAKDTFHFN